MKSIKEIYKIGRGPSSSHTIGPEKASLLFKKENPEATFFKVVLYGSLSSTGKGHGTDQVIIESLAPIPVDIVFDHSTIDLPHPNTMDFYAYKDNNQINYMRVLSVGGGYIMIEGRPHFDKPDIYKENHFAEISNYCKEKNIRISDYVEENEGPEIWDYLLTIWNQMKQSINNGLNSSGILPGGLNVEKKAKFLYNQKHIDESPTTKQNRLVCAYAFAVSEENADYKTIVTAPTCGACGTLPAVLKYMQDTHRFTDMQIVKALGVAGIIGNIVKTNASISGAEAGCQAEIGTACSMASAALCELFEMELDQIECASEIAMEHYLGLTCDPICGLVQIPCIERNAVAAMRSLNALSLANFLSSARKISFDLVVETMYETGKDLSRKYRETSLGGLAKLYNIKK